MICDLRFAALGGKRPPPPRQESASGFTKDPRPLYYKTPPCVFYHKNVRSKAVFGPQQGRNWPLVKRVVFLVRLKSWGWGSLPPLQHLARDVQVLALKTELMVERDQGRGRFVAFAFDQLRQPCDKTCVFQSRCLHRNRPRPSLTIAAKIAIPSGPKLWTACRLRLLQFFSRFYVGILINYLL